jgi:hypothetical protein
VKERTKEEYIAIKASREAHKTEKERTMPKWQ